MKTDALNFNAIKKELSVIFLYCGEQYVYIYIYI